MIESLHHASLLVQDLPLSLAFYCDLLGLEVDETRPDLGYSGAWLWVGAQQLHLLCLPNPDPCTGRPAHGGRDRHLAFKVRQFDALQERLRRSDITFTLSRSGRAALFVRDPDGNALEFIACEQ